ncbi:HK97 family phage prohead protease [Bradyrhizobium elkanii]|uniref:HK97 family phage prohead protease n=1 Tax=Bradyrhizobium elkanii TaxID=29448 RepID=UPI0021676931|nr:HK97 family phage prohead protease [Bradyrhizobium elkanii]MCS3689078.1 phage head maturation protease [Bradyrhizobium elkanii]
MKLPTKGQRLAQTSMGAPRSYDKKARTVEAVISVGAPVKRFFGTEVLRISKDAIDLSRPSIPLLDSHQQTGLDNHLGRITSARIESGKLVGTIQFDHTERGRQAEGMVARGEIAGISAGYTVDEWQITDQNGRVIDPEVERIRYDEDDLTFTAVRWTLYEASLVSVPADPAALIRSADPIDDAPDYSTLSNDEIEALPQHAREALRRMLVRQRMQARQRTIERMSDRVVDRCGSKNHTRDDRANHSENSNTMSPRIHVLRDERDGVADAMSLALCESILAGRSGSQAIAYNPVNLQERAWADRNRDRSRQYRGCSIVELAAIACGWRGSRFLGPQVAAQVFERAFNTTSDFPSIFSNALNKALLARYQLHTPTYREVAAERTFVDFRPHPQVRAGDFPMLQPVQQSGELAYGSTTDNNEPISVSPYGVVFTISRTALVNDQLGAIDQILSSAGDMVLVFENVTFYNMLNSNPVLNQDGTAVFATAHGNLAATGSDPSITSIAAGRQALRQMKTISGNLINVPPSIILTGPAEETAADQMVATISPTLTTSVNPFSGRLRSVSDANITDKSWYLLTDPARVPNFIYGFLAGSGGPRTRTFEPFGVQGIKISLEHDFGVGAIDFRGAWKSPAF